MVWRGVGKERHYCLVLVPIDSAYYQVSCGFAWLGLALAFNQGINVQQREPLGKRRGTVQYESYVIGSHGRILRGIIRYTYCMYSFGDIDIND
jgi:hypothetical protein